MHKLSFTKRMINCWNGHQKFSLIQNLISRNPFIYLLCHKPFKSNRMIRLCLFLEVIMPFQLNNNSFTSYWATRVIQKHIHFEVSFMISFNTWGKNLQSNIACEHELWKLNNICVFNSVLKYSGLLNHLERVPFLHFFVHWSLMRD